MDAKVGKKPCRNKTLRLITKFREDNRVTINWREFRSSAGKFIASTALTTVGIGIGAWALLIVNSTTDGAISAVACQALLGIASEPLMAVSALLLIEVGLFVAMCLVWLPRTGNSGRIREILKNSFKGIADFSTQLPLAIGGVGIATSLHYSAMPSLISLLPFCMLLTWLQKLAFSIIFYGGDHEQSTSGKWAAFALALAGFVGLAYLATILNWQQFLYPQRICN